MNERSRSLSKEEYLKELKKESPENLNRMLAHFDKMRLYTGAVSAGFSLMAIASASANYLGENEIVDQATFAVAVITSFTSMLSTIGAVRANYEGKIVAGELQLRCFKVSRGFIRRIRN